MLGHLPPVQSNIQLLELVQILLEDKKKKHFTTIFILFDYDLFKDVDSDLKSLIKDKTVVEYPSKQNKQKGI